MVQCMEPWFLSDKSKLKAYFGPDFVETSLAGHIHIEEVPKQQVLGSLYDASRNCRSKSPYWKSRHSFQILATLDPQRIRSASQHAEQFFSKLLAI